MNVTLDDNKKSRPCAPMSHVTECAPSASPVSPESAVAAAM